MVTSLYSPAPGLFWNPSPYHLLTFDAGLAPVTVLEQRILPPFHHSPLVSSTTYLLCSSLILKHIWLFFMLVMRLGKMITKCFAMVCLLGACTDLGGDLSLQELHWQSPAQPCLFIDLLIQIFVIISTSWPSGAVSLSGLLIPCSSSWNTF